MQLLAQVLTDSVKILMGIRYESFNRMIHANSSFFVSNGTILKRKIILSNLSYRAVPTNGSMIPGSWSSSWIYPSSSRSQFHGFRWTRILSSPFIIHGLAWRPEEVGTSYQSTQRTHGRKFVLFSWFRHDDLGWIQGWETLRPKFTSRWDNEQSQHHESESHCGIGNFQVFNVDLIDTKVQVRCVLWYDD